MEKITAENFFSNYENFVSELLSNDSTNFENYIQRLKDLNEQGCDISRLDTAAQGMSAEAGEFEEIVKKIKYQSKPWNEDNIFHLKREMGDIIFYWIVGCLSLKIDPIEVVKMNVEKLESRYPSGSFDVLNSEIRKKGDV